jgi:hypothetical protein
VKFIHRTATNGVLPTENGKNTATQLSESPIKKLENALSVNSSYIFSQPKKGPCIQKLRISTVGLALFDFWGISKDS